MALNIQPRTRLNVMGHVGDGNIEPPAAAFFGLAIDRIVKITGILAIDSHQRQMTQVDTMVLVGLVHLGTETLGFSFDAVRP